jgi:hypothetical protein
MRIATAVLCVLALASCAFAQAQESPREYAVNQSVPETGSHIARAIATSARIPLDKSYAELTPQQQGIVKSEYDHMGGADEPPFPVSGLQPIYKAIANAEPTVSSDGGLIILVDVDSKGDATSTTIVQAADPQIAKIATSALMREKYKPAMCNGIACKMQFRFHVLLSAR